MRRLLALLVCVAVSGCSEERIGAPRQQTLTGNLSFLEFDSAAFAAAEKSGSFWAVQGQARSLTLRYTDTGQEFLRFEVGPNSLPSADSVLISVTVDAGGRMSYSFEPSGLQFAGSAPATLTLDYSRASALLPPLIFKRDSALLPWTPLSTTLLGTTARADVRHFTDFALAAN